MALSLPLWGNGDFGTSPFFGQLSGQAVGSPLSTLHGVPGVTYNE